LEKRERKNENIKEKELCAVGPKVTIWPICGSLSRAAHLTTPSLPSHLHVGPAASNTPRAAHRHVGPLASRSTHPLLPSPSHHAWPYSLWQPGPSCQFFLPRYQPVPTSASFGVRCNSSPRLQPNSPGGARQPVRDFRGCALLFSSPLSLTRGTFPSLRIWTRRSRNKLRSAVVLG
jgi:hypothetical protein